MKNTSIFLYVVSLFFVGLAVFSFSEERHEEERAMERLTTVGPALAKAAREEAALEVGFSRNRQRAMERSLLNMEEFSFSQDNVESYCKENKSFYIAGSDEEKMADCIDNQFNSYEDLSLVERQLSGEVWSYESLPRIWNEYTSFRGVTAYSSVFREFIAEFEAHQIYEDTMMSEVDVNRMRQCENEWEHHVRRWRMTMYCYDKR